MKYIKENLDTTVSACVVLLVGIITLITCIYAFRSRTSFNKEVLDKIDNVKIELIKEIKNTKGN